MKNKEIISNLDDRKFNGHINKIKRIRTEPRQRILQLLRTFERLELPGRSPDSR